MTRGIMRKIPDGSRRVTKVVIRRTKRTSIRGRTSVNRRPITSGSRISTIISGRRRMMSGSRKTTASGIGRTRRTHSIRIMTASGSSRTNNLACILEISRCMLAMLYHMI